MACIGDVIGRTHDLHDVAEFKQISRCNGDSSEQGAHERKWPTALPQLVSSTRRRSYS